MDTRDRGYKRLFSHPDMVRDLLTGFVREEWVADLDLSTLERQSGSFVADDLREREDDMIWRVRLRDRWLYVYVLLEFQSAVDRFMAVRVMTYVGLLYQDLARRAELVDGKLPPVVPIVLHAGDAAWNAARDVADLIVEAPSGLDRWKSRVSYLLLEERSLAGAADLSLRNLAGALFRLEHDREPRAILEVVSALAEWLAAPERADLRRAFEAMLARVLEPRLGVEPAPTGLLETKTMLETHLKQWEREWMERGLAKGLAEGLAQGLAEGLAKGHAEGQAAFLLHQLEQRFGSLDEAHRERIASASSEQLLAYADRVLEAQDLESVFKVK